LPRPLPPLPRPDMLLREVVVVGDERVSFVHFERSVQLLRRALRGRNQRQYTKFPPWSAWEVWETAFGWDSLKFVQPGGAF
jgi:hypothetical protein